MHTLEESGTLKEAACGNNFEYILEGHAYFEETVYKMLLSQTNGIFVPCMKMMRNGKLSLYYITDGCQPMSSLLADITMDAFMAIAVHLFADIIEVKSNGFLSCQSIGLSWDKIFVEQNTRKVKLVYLPVSEKAFASYAEFESELRSGLVKLIHKTIADPTERVQRFAVDLSNGSLSIEDVYNRSRSNAMPSAPVPGSNPVPAPPSLRAAIKLVAMNAPSYFEVEIDRDEMLLGKKKEAVDGFIPFNPMISRKHCKITKTDGNFYISDIGSSNGTYVNRVRVEEGQTCQIHRGDIVRLANSDFQIV